jgi:hypothetical protein
MRETVKEINIPQHNNLSESVYCAGIYNLFQL